MKNTFCKLDFNESKSKTSIWNNRNLQSEQLLDTAKHAVEIAIEQDEEAAIRYIEEA